MRAMVIGAIHLAASTEIGGDHAYVQQSTSWLVSEAYCKRLALRAHPPDHNG